MGAAQGCPRHKYPPAPGTINPSLICPGSSPAPHPSKQLLSVEDASCDTKTLLGMSRGAGRLRTAGFTRGTPTLPLHGARPYFPARAGGAPRSHPCLVTSSRGTKVGRVFEAVPNRPREPVGAGGPGRISGRPIGAAPRGYARLRRQRGGRPDVPRPPRGAHQQMPTSEGCAALWHSRRLRTPRCGHAEP